MNEHHSNKVIIRVEKRRDTRKTFIRTIPNSIDKQNFIGDLIDEYYYLMNEDEDRSIMFYDDVDNSIFICRRSDVLSIEISPA